MSFWWFSLRRAGKMGSSEAAWSLCWREVRLQRERLVGPGCFFWSLYMAKISAKLVESVRQLELRVSDPDPLFGRSLILVHADYYS